jgi:large subunit ribosomal protein L11
MAKKIIKSIKLEIKAGLANPSPPVGPALGQHGVNIMEFCNQFNKSTKKLEEGAPTPVIVSIYSDKSFTFIIKTPPTSYLIKKHLNIKLGSKEPNKNKVGVLTMEMLKAIAIVKLGDLNAFSLEAAMRIVAGTAASMGVDLEQDNN